MAPHMNKEITLRPRHEVLSKAIKKKKWENIPPMVKKIVEVKEENEPIIRVGAPMRVSDDIWLEVEERLGNGSFGEVYKVKRDNYDASFAMKVVRADSRRKEERAVKEAEFLKYLSQQNIGDFCLGVLDTFLYSRNGQKVMCQIFELMDRPLSDIMRENEYMPMETRLVKATGFQLLSALERLHQIGVTHCDIKPDNVMIVDMVNCQLRVKLIDFGLAHFTQELPRGTRMQNIRYRAPEVLFGLPLTEAIDIWSLAILLAKMYTGEDLFPAKYEPELGRYIEDLVGFPEELADSRAMTYTESQVAGLEDTKTDRRVIPSLKELPLHGQNYLLDFGVQEEDELFLEVLHKMLKPTVSERIGAKEALQEEFFSSFDQDYDPPQ